MNQINETNEWIGKLKKSPIFNMSLSSKELFHSNFLAWIFESYPEKSGEFFCKKLGIDPSQIQNVEREKNNIDIQFSLGDMSIIIENKVKSIANTDQLNKYVERFGTNHIYFLLALKKPNFFDSDNKYGEWTYVSYKEIKCFLTQLQKDIKEDYHKSIVSDYNSYIDILINNVLPLIDEMTILSFKDHKNALIDELKNIRLHDFIQKGVFENFAYKLQDQLCKEPQCNQCNKAVGEVIEYSGKQLHIKHDFSNGQGLVEIQSSCNDNLIFGIQIQGNQYRRFMICTLPPVIPHGFWPDDYLGNGRNNQGYCQFKIKNKNKVFIYKYKRIDVKKIEDLLIQMCNDIYSLCGLVN